MHAMPQQRRLSFPHAPSGDSEPPCKRLLEGTVTALCPASFSTTEPPNTPSGLSEAGSLSVDSLVSGVDTSPREHTRSKSRRRHKQEKNSRVKSPVPASPKQWKAEVAEAVAETVAGQVLELLQTFRSESIQQLTDMSTSLHSLMDLLEPLSHGKRNRTLSNLSRELASQLAGPQDKYEDTASSANVSVISAAAAEEKWQVCGAGAAAVKRITESKLQAAPPALAGGGLPTLLPRVIPPEASAAVQLSAALHPASPGRFNSEGQYSSSSIDTHNAVRSDPGTACALGPSLQEKTRSVSADLAGELDNMMLATSRYSSAHDSVSETDSLSSHVSSAADKLCALVREGMHFASPEAPAPRVVTLPDRLAEPHWKRRTNKLPTLTYSSSSGPSNAQSFASGCPRPASRSCLLRRSLELPSPGAVRHALCRSPMASSPQTTSRVHTIDNLYEVQRMQEKMLLETDAKMTQERRLSAESRSSGLKPKQEYKSSCPLDQDRNDKRNLERRDLQVFTKVSTSCNSVNPDHTGLRTQQRHTTKESQATSITPITLAESSNPCECPSFSLEALRRQRNNELSKIAFSNENLSDSCSSDPEDHIGHVQSFQRAQRRLRLVYKLTLRVWGVVPWRPTGVAPACYQITAVLVVTCVAVCAVVRLASSSSDNGLEEELAAHMLVSTGPLALAGMLGLTSMQNQLAKELFWSYPGPLETYATQHGFIEQWTACSLRRFSLVFVVWASAVFLCALFWGFSEAGMLCGRIDLLSFLCFFFGSGVYAALIFCQIHFFGMLEIMVDQFCIKFFQDPEVERGLMEWNLVQAILRRVATALDTCFLATQVMAQVTFVVSATYAVMADRLHSSGQEMDHSQECNAGYRALAFLPSVLLAFGAWTLVFFGAAVTEKCSRVPAMINTMTFDDCKRQSMVQYVMNSAAGLYIKEVRLTASVVMKLTYVTGLWVLAVLTEFIGKK